MDGWDRIMGMERMAEIHRRSAQDKRDRGDLLGAATNELYAKRISETIERVMESEVRAGRM